MSKPFLLNLISVILISLSVLYFFSCEEAAEPKRQTYPIIQTNAVTDIDSSGVAFNGELLKIGTDEVLDYGFVWSTDSKPTTQDFIISLGKNIKSRFSIKVKFDLITYQNYSVRTFVVTSKNIVYGNEETFTSLGSSKPIIKSFSPMNGIDGDTVTIQGENFGSTMNSNIVKIGTVTAIVLSTNNTTLKISIPAIPQSGSYKIQVTSNSNSGISSEEFVVENPIISSLTPDKGPDGTTVTINGEYFSYNKIFNKVYLNQMLCQVIESNRNQLKVVTPVTQFVGNTKVIISINGKTSVSVNDFFVEGPYITDINPLQGSYNDVVTISGEGFSSISSENIVMFGPLKATILAASATELSVAVPDLPGDPVTVSIRKSNKTHNYPNKFLIVNPWNRISSTLPFGKRGMATGFSIGNRGFITLGRISDYNLFQTSTNREMYTDLWEYNSTSNLWTKRPDFPGIARYYPVSFSIGSKGFVGSGVAKYGDLLSDFYEYDSENNSWTQISNMPGVGRYAAVAFSANGKGYVGLGQGTYEGSNPYKKDFFEYDPLTNTWKQFNGPGKSSAYDFSFSVNDRGFVVIDGKDLWELEPSTYTWIKRADYPDNSPFGSFSFTIGNKAYAGSGLYSAGSTLYYSRNFYEYDPANDKWTELKGFEYLKRYTGIAWGLDNKGYLLTGQSNAQVIGSWPYYYLNDFWIFNYP